jgi:CheY-like chemotaxis protein
VKRKPVVLIVDDDADTSQVMALLLGVEGLEVVSASNGLEALDMCESEKPDLIITELRLPGMSGIKIIKTLRAAPGRGQVPIVVHTAHAQELAAAAIEAGADGVISKTQTRDLLFNMVKGLLPDTS